MPPSLILDTLKEVFLEIIQDQQGDSMENEPLEKFMLSGIQQLNIALAFFERTVQIDVYHNRIMATVNSWDRREYAYAFSYNFSLINTILKIVGDKISSLIIPEQPIECEDIDIIGSLIGRNLQLFTLAVPLLSVSHQNLLKQHQTLPKIGLFYVSTLKDLAMIPPSCRVMHIDKIRFAALLQDKPSNLTLSSIKELSIYGDFNHQNYNTENILKFSSFITETFPNLEILEVSFECPFFVHEEMFDQIATLQAHMFHSFPQQIKGFCRFRTCDYTQWSQEIIDRYAFRPEFAMDDLFQVIVRRINVHYQFYFKFVLTVHREYAVDEDNNYGGVNHY